VTVPDPDLAERYARLFSIYRDVRGDMTPTWAKLSELKREDHP